MIQDCNGAGVAGATITGTHFGPPGYDPPDVVYGVTDSAGTFTFSGIAPADQRNRFRIDYEGVGLTYPMGGSHPAWCDEFLHFCYIKAKLTINSTAEANPVLLDGTPSSGGVITINYKRFVQRLCDDPPVPLLDDYVTVYPTVDGYLSNCEHVTLYCGTEQTVGIPLFKWDDDYAVQLSPSCDEGCVAQGMGPNNRGVVPKELFVTLTSDDGGGGNVDWYLLGNAAGVSIPITWNGSTGWHSACLEGVDASCSPFLPTADTGLPSARTGIGYDPATGSFVPYFSSYNMAGCVSGPAPPALCDSRLMALGGVSPNCGIQAPTDAHYAWFVPGGYRIFMHVTE